MSNKVVIEIVSEDKTKGGINSAKLNLRDLGEKISNVGVRLSAALTGPIVGLGMLLAKNEAITRSLEPIKYALTPVINQLARGLVPVIRDLTPTIITAVRSIGELVSKFARSPVEQKKMVLSIIGIIGAIGPLITIIGQAIGFVGTLQTIWAALSAAFAGAGTAAAGTAAAGIGAVILPVIALGAALVGLWITIKYFGKDAWNTIVTIGKIIGMIPVLIRVKLTDAWNAIRGFFENAWQTVVNKFNQIREKVMDFFARIRVAIMEKVEAIKRIFDTDWIEVGKKIIQKIKDGIEAKAKELIDKVTQIVKDIGSFINFIFSGKITANMVMSAISGRAAGGLTVANRPYVVGEMGPELFVPATSGTIIPNGGLNSGTKIIQMTYSPIISLATEAEAERALLPIVQRVMRSLS